VDDVYCVNNYKLSLGQFSTDAFHSHILYNSIILGISMNDKQGCLFLASRACQMTGI